MVCISSLDNEIKMIKKGKMTKESNIFYYPTDVIWLLITLYCMIRAPYDYHMSLLCKALISEDRVSFSILYLLIISDNLRSNYSILVSSSNLSCSAFLSNFLRVYPTYQTKCTLLLGNEDLLGGLVSIFPFISCETETHRSLNGSSQWCYFSESKHYPILINITNQ